jgi:uncharacterized protein (DUF849 family)
MEKVIITVAVTGSQPTRQMNPNLPVTPQEIADSALECLNEGASVAHIHVRDPKTGVRSMAYELYEEVVERLRAKSSMIINLTTGPGGQLSVGPDNKPRPEASIIESAETRVSHVLRLKPEMCSLDVGSSNVGGIVFLNAQPVIDRMAELIKSSGVKPEVELFDVGQVSIAERLMKLGLLDESAHFQLCMGVNGGIPATPKNATLMAEALPKGVTWSIFGVARTQFPMVAMGTMLGGHVRVGMEDNLYMSRGVLAKSNAELVQRAVQIVRSLGREVASLEEARAALRLAA